MGLRGARCDLLAPATRAALEPDGSAPCPDAVGDVPPGGGEVRSVEIWGGNAQVRVAGGTLFLVHLRRRGSEGVRAGGRPHARTGETG